MPEKVANGWNEYARLVLKELESHEAGIEKNRERIEELFREMIERLANQEKEREVHHKELDDKIEKIEKGLCDDINKINNRVSKLEWRSGIWGALGSFVALGATLLTLLRAGIIKFA